MPEGDTIHRAAACLNTVLVDQIIERAESRWLGEKETALQRRKSKASLRAANIY